MDFGKLMETIAHKIACSIIRTLHRRKGFEYWWADLESDLQEQIIEDLETSVQLILDKQ